MEKKAELCYPTKKIINKHFNDDFSKDTKHLGKELYANEKCSDGGMYSIHPMGKTGIYKIMAEQDFPFMGIDIPVLIKHGSRKKIMLIAQDPNRNKTYTNSKGSKENVFVGTPFALNSKECKDRYVALKGSGLCVHYVPHPSPSSGVAIKSIAKSIEEVSRATPCGC